MREASPTGRVQRAFRDDPENTVGALLRAPRIILRGEGRGKFFHCCDSVALLMRNFHFDNFSINSCRKTALGGGNERGLLRRKKRKKSSAFLGGPSGRDRRHRWTLSEPLSTQEGEASPETRKGREKEFRAGKEDGGGGGAKRKRRVPWSCGKTAGHVSGKKGNFIFGRDSFGREHFEERFSFCFAI